MLKKVIDVLCESTNWKTPYSNKKNEQYFILDNNVHFTIFSPNGQTVIMYVNLMPIDENDRENFIKNLAQKSAGFYKKRHSILSINNNMVCLHCVLQASDCTPQNIQKQAKNLLNDVDVCYTLLSNKNHSSPFSFLTFTIP